MCSFSKKIRKYLLDRAKLTNSEMVLEWLLHIHIPHATHLLCWKGKSSLQLSIANVIDSYFGDLFQQSQARSSESLAQLVVSARQGARA